MFFHRKRLLLAFGLLFSLLLGAFPASGKEAVRIVKLSMQSPEQVATILRQTFGREIRVAEAPMVNGVVIAADQETTLDQAEALIRQLDQKPKSLKYQVRMTSREQWNQLTGGVRMSDRTGVFAIDPVLESRIGNSSGGETRTIVGLEGQPVSLFSEMTRVENLYSPWGPQDAVRKERRGIFVTGRLVDQDRQAMIEIGYSEGEFNDSRKIQTQVCVPLNSWICLGDLVGGSQDAQWSGEVRGSSGRLVRNRHHTDNSRVYFLRIEKTE